MAQVYTIPDVGNLSFSSYSGTNPSQDTLDNVNIIISGGIHVGSGHADAENPSYVLESYWACNEADTFQFGYYYTDASRTSIKVAYKIISQCARYTAIVFSTPAGRYDLASTVYSPGIIFPNYIGFSAEGVLNAGLSIFDNINQIKAAFGIAFPITYRPTNCSFPNAPTEAAVGDTVIVPVTFPDGYGLVNESNIYVTNNGVAVPSTYSNGQLTFTMPDPS